MVRTTVDSNCYLKVGLRLSFLTVVSSEAVVKNEVISFTPYYNNEHR